MTNLLYILLFIGFCLLVFIPMYDHCVNGEGWLRSLKKLLVQVFVSPITITIVKIAIVGTVLYLIYTMFHDSSIF